MSKAKGLVLFHIMLFLLIYCGQASAQGSNTCAGAIANQITIPNSFTNQSTCGDGNDYTGTNGCLPSNGWSNPYGGQDWLYAFTPTQSGIISISVTNISATGTALPVMSLFSTCPGTANACLASVQTSNGNPSSLVYQVTAGTTYLINIDAYSLSSFYANCFGFTLNIAFSPTIVQPACSNMGFANGNLTSWVATSGTAVTATSGSPTPTYVMNSLGVNPGRHTVMTGGNDPCAGFPRVDPLGGPFSVRLGNNNTGAEADQLKQTFLVSASNSSFTYRYAVVFEDPGHSSNEQPFFRALLRSQDGSVVPCSEFIVSAAASLPGFFNSTTCQGVRYKPWSTVNVDLSNYLGQPVTVEFTAGDCSQGGHFGYAYIDANCAPSTLAELSDTICPGQSTTLTAPTGYASYSWQPGNLSQQTITVTPSQTTTYTLGLTAFNGCVSNFQVPIVVSTVPVAAFNYQAPACDLPVQLNATTAGSTNIYAWNLAPAGTPASSSQQTFNASFPGPGNYPIQLSVTNSAGCSSSITQNIIVPPCEFRIAITGDTICPGNCLSFTPSIAFGAPPYSYTWSTGSSATSINVCANQSTLITLTMIDADGSIATDTAMITIVPSSQIQAILTNLNCYQSSNGQISTNVTGWGPFTYLWSNGLTSSGLIGLNAGTYSVTVTDRFGCTADSTFIITQPQPLTASSISVSAQCGIDNGAVSINQVSGGTPTYTYSLNGQGATSSSTFSDLAPGNYSILVTDANSCSTSVTSSVASLSMPVSMQVNIQNATCGLPNGQLSIQSIQGGFAPYSFTLNSGSAQSLVMPHGIANLGAGNYSVIITDSLGCNLDSSFTITQLIGPSALGITLQNSTCDLDNGTLNITNVVDGSPSYLYSINSGSASAQTTYQNLAPGAYLVEVLDQNQCSYDTTVQLLAIPSLQIQAIADAQVLCHGGSNGSGHAQVLSGSNPVNFQWSNGASGNMVSSLTIGSYIVTGTDANNCVDTSTITIIEPAALSFSEISVNPVCGNTNGSIQVVEMTGGVIPYQYQFDNGAWGSSSTMNQLAAGIHQVCMRDANMCADSAQVQLIMPSYPTSLNTNVIDAVCDENNGRLSLNSILGGVAPFQYHFNDSVLQPLSQFPLNFNDLDAGVYPFGIRDANGCSVDSSRVIVRYLGPSAMVISSTDATCTLSNSTVNVTSVVGGTQPYTFTLNGQNASTNQFSGLAPGQYLLTATDVNGCMIDSLVQTFAIPTVGLNTLITHPITCYGYSDGALLANITSGVAPFNITWNNGQLGISADSLTVGVYTATVTDSNGCTASSSFNMPQPPPVQVDVTGPSYVCENASVTLNASASGGTDHLDIEWIGFNHLGESMTVLPSSSRFYTVRASDIFGCNANDSTSVMLRTNPSGTLAADVAEGCAPVCVNFSVNSAGTANLTSYAWVFNTGQNGNNAVQKVCFNQSGSPEVSVHLVDEFGCSSTLHASGLVTVHDLPDARFSINPNHADVINPVYRLINQSTYSDTYFWTFGDGHFSAEESPTHQYPDTGSYEVCLKVSTSFGCEDFACKTLNVDPFPTIYAPNAFTPNADGTNDRFLIKLTYVDKFLLEIFDRWGELIYTSTDPNDGWDGTYMQNKVQEDVYVWRVTYTNILQKPGQMIGRVTLIE
jgi:gliding motility-associated-like protein